MMTIRYSEEVRQIGSFQKVLFTYRGSVYQLIKFELVIYLALYAFISIMYHFILPPNIKLYFESFTVYCQSLHSQISITFVLSFYMNHVIQRWWEAFNLIPWPDDLAMKLNILFPNYSGREDECMQIKQAIMRYANLSIIETFRMISSPVKNRFPTYQHLVDAGLMTDSEMNIMKNALLRSEVSETGYWLPLNWAGNLLVKAGQEKMICGRYVSDTVDTINAIRGLNGSLILFGWVNVPN